MSTTRKPRSTVRLTEKQASMVLSFRGPPAHWAEFLGGICSDELFDILYWDHIRPSSWTADRDDSLAACIEVVPSRRK